MKTSETKNMAGYGKITLQEFFWDLIWSDYWWFIVIVNNVKVNWNFVREIINKLEKKHLW